MTPGRGTTTLHEPRSWSNARLQAVNTGAYGVAVASAGLGDLVTSGILVLLSLVAIASATVAAVAQRRRETQLEQWLVAPGLSLVAMILFREGTGSTASIYTALLILPILWVASEARRRWIAVALLVVAASLLMPYLLRPPVDRLGMSGIMLLVEFVIFLVAALFLNGLSRQKRSQLASITALARERVVMLQEAVAAAEQMKENEERLRAADQFTRGVLDAVTEQAVIGTDLAGFIDVWNPGASRLLHLGPHETQGRRYVHEFHDPEELQAHARATGQPDAFDALVQVARAGRAEVRDWTYLPAEGEPVSVRVAVTPRLDRVGETVGYIFVATDITEVIETARLKDEFISLISHELRTPLSSILGYLELIRDDEVAPLSDEQAQYLGVAERNAHRLLRLVSDLLFTAQVESGQFTLSRADVDLRAVVQTAVESAYPSAATAGVSLDCRLPHRPVLVAGDAVRLGQASDNLISNALKFTPRGGRVTVDLSAGPAGAVMSVTDTGMGIPAAEVDQLFSRFFRASTASRHAVPGVGLGLSITKAIVQAHDGEIAVTSDEGIGTTFTVSIPAAEPEASAA